MSEVGAPDRSRLLRSKRTELSGIVASRKRKLREFFAVCDSDGPIPQLHTSTLDAPPTTAAEAHFLDVSDILQNRAFDASNLPTRRKLRSDTAKQRSPARKPSPDGQHVDVSRKAAKVQRDGSRSRKSRAPTPGAKSDGTQASASIETKVDGAATSGLSIQSSAPQSSQSDLPPESSVLLDEIVEETFENAAKPEVQIADSVIPAKALESDRIRSIESRPNSPGVDPRKAMPILAEDAAQLSEPLVPGLGSHDYHHKATVAHLPSQEVQEQRIRDAEEARDQKKQGAGRLSIHLPARDGGRVPEPLSSPGSTVDAQSATTPAVHDASTDTSPENDNSRYDVDVDGIDKDDEAQTPPEMRPTPEEVAEKEEHDRLLRAQMEVSRAEILGSSPTAADNQLRMEEQAASLTEKAQNESSADEVADNEATDNLTKEASDVVEDIIDDEAVDAVPTNDDSAMSGVEEPPNSKESEKQSGEVPDSEAEVDTPVDAMDVDATTVKDSFESNTALEDAANTPNVPKPVDAAPSATTDAAAADPRSSSTTSAVSTPRKSSSAAPTPTPTLERMTTRVSSGAMRHKSVSEILGEIPRPNTTSSERSPTKGAEAGSTENSASPSRSLTPQSPGSRIRTLAEKAKERERSKLSTVTFSRRANRPNSNDTALMPSGPQASKPVQDDYFTPLFIHNAISEKKIAPLEHLLSSANKTISTSNAFVPILESQAVKVLKRIYTLQSVNKWSLRQPKRALEAVRPTTHWDVFLQEAKWMRTDFREERKWKMTVARNLAFACAEWVASSPEDRKILQVKAAVPKPSESDLPKDTEMSASSHQELGTSTPELIASGDTDSAMDDLDVDSFTLMDTVAPAAIFTLQDDDVVFGLRKSPTADKLLGELPMYGQPLTVPQSDIPTSEIDPDRHWRRPALALSKYVDGKMILKSDPPPRKKSRFEYDDESDDDDQIIFGEQRQKRPILSPESTEVALFNPEHKHIRDRIHSSHQFRPPSEFPMPLQSFFETRIPSQWTLEEDIQLKNYVREFTYNWALISDILSSKSIFSSGAERRTPWECFERWIHLEGLPADMQKTHYFRAYNTRIDTANRNVQAQAAAVPPGAAVGGQIQPPIRRRTTSSIRVDRRRNQKHLTLVDAMRKLAKKRETSIQKQQQAAGMAAMRKANDNNPAAARGPVHTPQYFSQMKHEREEQMRDRVLQLQQRQEAQRRAVMLQQRNAQNPQHPGLQSGPQQRGPPPVNGQLPPNGASGSTGQNLTVPGQRPRPLPPKMSQPLQNNMRNPQPLMNGIPQAPMQGMQGQLPTPNPSVSANLITQAAQTAESQRAMIQMQQQGKLPGQSPQMHNSPPRANGMPQPPGTHGFAMQQNMMGYTGNTNGIPTPPINGMVPSPGPGHGQSGSPRMTQAQHSQDPSRLTQMVALEQTLSQQHPNASREEIRSMANEHMRRSVQQRGLAHSAMQAAAGAAGGQGQRIPGPENSPQLYAQMLRQQQEAQQKAEKNRQANSANSLSVGQQNSGSSTTGHPTQGHAHRNSSSSVQSGK